MGAQLLAVSTTLTAAQRLQRAVGQGTKAASGSRQPDVLAVLSTRVKVQPQPDLVCLTLLLNRSLPSEHRLAPRAVSSDWQAFVFNGVLSTEGW